jgi:hypothetical protein
MHTIIANCEAVTACHAEQMMMDVTEHDATLTAAINTAMEKIIVTPATIWAELLAKAKTYLLIDRHELGMSLARDILTMAETWQLADACP